MGGAESEVGDATTRVIVESRDLRPDRHPPDRPALRPPLRGEPPVREGPGVPARPDRRRPGGPPHRRVGRRLGRPRPGRQRTRPSRAPARVPFRPGPGQPAARDGARAPTSSGRSSPASASRPEPAPPDRPIGSCRSPASRKPLTRRRRRRRGRRRRDRPDLAPRHRDRGRRRRGGRPRPRLRAIPGDPAPHADAGLAAVAARACATAIRETLAGAGLTEVVSHALVSPRLAETFAWDGRDRRPSTAGRRRGGRPIRVTNPLSADHSVLRPALVGSLVEIVSTNVRRGRDDVAIFEIGKGYGRRRRRHPREWWRLALALAGAGRGAGLEPARAAVRPRRREGRDRAGLPPARVRRADVRAAQRTSRCSIRAGPPRVDGRARRRRGRRWRGRRRAPPGDRRRGATCAAPGSIVAELDVAGLGRRPAGRRPRRGAVAPSGRGARSRRSSSPRTRPAGDVAAADPRRRRARRSHRSRLFDIYRGAPLAADEKSLAWRLVFQAAGPDARPRRRSTAAIAAITRALGRDRRPDQDLSPACARRIPRCYPVARLAPGEAVGGPSSEERS